MIPKDSSGLMTEVQKLAAVEAYAEALRAFGGKAERGSTADGAEGTDEPVACEVVS